MQSNQSLFDYLRESDNDLLVLDCVYGPEAYGSIKPLDLPDKAQHRMLIKKAKFPRYVTNQFRFIIAEEFQWARLQAKYVTSITKAVWLRPDHPTECYEFRRLTFGPYTADRPEKAEVIIGREVNVLLNYREAVVFSNCYVCEVARALHDGRLVYHADSSVLCPKHSAQLSKID